MSDLNNRFLASLQLWRKMPPIWHIPLIYAFFSYLWIIFSDRFLLLAGVETHETLVYQTFKGLFFVSITSLLIYILIRKHQKRLLAQQRVLLENERKYRLLFQKHPLPIWVYQRQDEVFLAANKVAIERYGYMEEELLKMRLPDMLLKHEPPIFIHKKGTAIFVETYHSPIEWQGKPSVMLTAIDITEKTLAEREKQAVLKELNDFVYRASHDLRGPIVRILGLVQVLYLENLNAQSLHYLQLLEHTSERLDAILKRLLLVNTLKNTQATATPIPLHEWIENFLSTWRNEHPYFKFENQISEPITLYADATLLQIIFENLIENSLQYRSLKEDDGVWIGLLSAEEVQNLTANHDKTLPPSFQALFIADNGIGIEREAQTRLFEMFYRGTERSQGSGLGLYMAHLAAQKMGGELFLGKKEDTNAPFLAPYTTFFVLLLPL